jgi:hypothetical protein
MKKEPSKRRINAYFKSKKKLKSSDDFSHRLEIFIDGKFTLGVSFDGEEPKCSYDLNELLKKLITDKNVW